MDDLELELVAIAKCVEVFLAREQRLGIEIQLVIERALAVHDGVEMIPVHTAPGYQWWTAP